MAVKVVHAHLSAVPGFIPRFEREARAGRSVDHPHVVHTLATGEQDRAELKSLPDAIRASMGGGAAPAR